jgi:hypothetical protein
MNARPATLNRPARPATNPPGKAGADTLANPVHRPLLHVCPDEQEHARRPPQPSDTDVAHAF